MDYLQRGNAYDDPIIIDSSEDSEGSTLTFQDLESVDSAADVNSFPDSHNPVQPAQMVYNAAGIHVATEHPFGMEHMRQDLQNDLSNQAPARLPTDGGLHNVPDEAPGIQVEGIGTTSLTQGQSSRARNEDIYPEDLPSNKLPRIAHGEEGSSKGDIGSSKGKGKE